MKKLFTLLMVHISPSMVFAHGKHAQTDNDALHGWMHLALGIEAVLVVALLGFAVYLMIRK